MYINYNSRCLARNTTHLFYFHFCHSFIVNQNNRNINLKSLKMNILYVVQIELNPLSMDLFNSHLLHVLLNLFQRNIKHTRDIFRGYWFNISFRPFFTYEVCDALFEGIVVHRLRGTSRDCHLITIGFLLLESKGLVELIGGNSHRIGSKVQLDRSVCLCLLQNILHQLLAEVLTTIGR